MARYRVWKDRSADCAAPLQYEVEAQRLEVEHGALKFITVRHDDRYVDLYHTTVVKAFAPGHWTHVDEIPSETGP
jgi:hypothetical protein